MKQKIMKSAKVFALALAILVAGNCIVPASHVEAATKKPAKVKITSVKSAKAGQLAVKYKKVSKAKGYQIKIGINKKMTKNKKVAKTKKLVKTFKNLKKGKTYYVKVRAYRKSGKKTVYGKWSAVKKAKVQKAKPEKEKHYSITVPAPSRPDSGSDSDSKPAYDDKAKKELEKSIKNAKNNIAENLAIYGDKTTKKAWEKTFGIKYGNQKHPNLEYVKNNKWLPSAEGGALLSEGIWSDAGLHAPWALYEVTVTDAKSGKSWKEFWGSCWANPIFSSCKHGACRADAKYQCLYRTPKDFLNGKDVQEHPAQDWQIVNATSMESYRIIYAGENSYYQMTGGYYDTYGVSSLDGWSEYAPDWLKDYVENP